MSASASASAHSCTHCGMSALLQCSRCNTTPYCGSVCQRTHWKTHKSSCTPAAAPAAPPMHPLLKKLCLWQKRYGGDDCSDEARNEYEAIQALFRQTLKQSSRSDDCVSFCLLWQGFGICTPDGDIEVVPAVPSHTFLKLVSMLVSMFIPTMPRSFHLYPPDGLDIAAQGKLRVAAYERLCDEKEAVDDE